MTYDASELSEMQRVFESDFQQSYALIKRAENRNDTVELLIGHDVALENISALDAILAEQKNAAENTAALIIAPYRQIVEQGFSAIDDHAALIALLPHTRCELTTHDLLENLPEEDVQLTSEEFRPTTEEYKSIISQVISNEIGAGSGSNFVIRRDLVGQIQNYDNRIGLSIFRKLLQQEAGAYWTFLIRTRDITLVGASPERHISMVGGELSMTPISGTYRYPSTGPTKNGLLEFLSDEKESDELSMVLDEEMKMMASMCESGLTFTGPSLIRMSRLAHTGYEIKGRSNRSISRILINSMFAPTVVGSPIENAARVIAKYEPTGRSYYSGFAAMVELGKNNSESIDSAILIRTAEVSKTGAVKIGVGSTIVRGSVPEMEAAETEAKVSGIRDAICSRPAQSTPFENEEVSSLLEGKAKKLSTFWWKYGNFERKSSNKGINILNRKITIIDNEDRFTSMLSYILKSMEYTVRILPWNQIIDVFSDDILLIGPGPGSPCDGSDPRIKENLRLIGMALEQRYPLVGICLGHQLLCSALGVKIERMKRPNQGLQKRIDFFGKQEIVGLYNTFYGVFENNAAQKTLINEEISYDKVTGHIYGLRNRRYASMQFHPESVLTVDGPRLLGDAINSVISA